jgi:DNA-nicking Smr family endonuclease
MSNPFSVLEDMVREGRLRLASPLTPADAVEPQYAVAPLPETLSEDDLFQHAMRDVRALGWSATPLHFRAPVEIQTQNGEQEALLVLQEFMVGGDLEIEYTPEYIEGAVQPRGRLYLDDLRSGRFSVQAHLDLHGLNQQEARFALDEFILNSLREQKTCIRVIHGRGRHSHKQLPVLKESIQRWLCSRRLSRHVVAYTSARLCDGGGGAVYILLRI